MDAAEKRRFPRARVNFPVMMEVDYGPMRRKVAHAYDISVDGICIYTNAGLPLNVPLIIHFPREWAQAFAIVKALRQNGHHYGCQFVSISPTVSQAIGQAVRSYRHQPTPASMHTLWKEL